MSNVKKVDNIKLRLKMKFRFITKLFIYLLFVIFVLVLNTFVRRESNIPIFQESNINIPNKSSPDQKPWYMKGGTILPTNNINRELIFPEDYPNNDRIPQQLMLMPPSINSISKIYSTCPKF